MKADMKAVVLRRYRQNALLLAAVFALALAGAGAAQAFTLTDQDGNSGGSGSSGSSGSMFLDRDGKTPTPDAPASRFGNGTTTIQQGNGTLRFGGNGGSFNQRYNSNNLFDPYARDGR